VQRFKAKSRLTILTTAGRVGKGALAPCPPSRTRFPIYLEWWARHGPRIRAPRGFAHPTIRHKIACGKNLDVFPVIGFSSSRIDNPHGVWSTNQLPTTGYDPAKFGNGAKA